eukprot:s1834_g3.t1
MAAPTEQQLRSQQLHEYQQRLAAQRQRDEQQKLFQQQAKQAPPTPHVSPGQQLGQPVSTAQQMQPQWHHAEQPGLQPAHEQQQLAQQAKQAAPAPHVSPGQQPGQRPAQQMPPPRQQTEQPGLQQAHRQQQFVPPAKQAAPAPHVSLGHQLRQPVSAAQQMPPPRQQTEQPGLQQAHRQQQFLPQAKQAPPAPHVSPGQQLGQPVSTAQQMPPPRQQTEQPGLQQAHGQQQFVQQAKQAAPAPHVSPGQQLGQPVSTAQQMAPPHPQTEQHAREQQFVQQAKQAPPAPHVSPGQQLGQPVNTAQQMAPPHPQTEQPQLSQARPPRSLPQPLHMRQPPPQAQLRTSFGAEQAAMDEQQEARQMATLQEQARMMQQRQAQQQVQLQELAAWQLKQHEYQQYEYQVHQARMQEQTELTAQQVQQQEYQQYEYQVQQARTQEQNELAAQQLQQQEYQQYEYQVQQARMQEQTELAAQQLQQQEYQQYEYQRHMQEHSELAARQQQHEHQQHEYQDQKRAKPASEAGEAMPFPAGPVNSGFWPTAPLPIGQISKPLLPPARHPGGVLPKATEPQQASAASMASQHPGTQQAQHTWGQPSLPRANVQWKHTAETYMSPQARGQQQARYTGHTSMAAGMEAGMPAQQQPAQPAQPAQPPNLGESPGIAAGRQTMPQGEHPPNMEPPTHMQQALDSSLAQMHPGQQQTLQQGPNLGQTPKCGGLPNQHRGMGNQQQPPGEQTRMTINSVTHPHAYAFLNRLCANGESKGVPEDVLAMWRSKGPEKNKLLGLFVTRCYNRDEDSNANRFLTNNFAKDLGIGDVLELSDQEDEPPNGEKPPEPNNTGKKKPQPFPDLEGTESVADFISKYKKQCLLRKTQFREMQEKFDSDIAKAYEALCEMEIAQCAKNPGNKGVYSDLTAEIRDLCTRFSNQQATCKTHLKKPTAKGKAGAKRQPKHAAKEEVDDS